MRMSKTTTNSTNALPVPSSSTQWLQFLRSYGFHPKSSAKIPTLAASSQWQNEYDGADVKTSWYSRGKDNFKVICRGQICKTWSMDFKVLNPVKKHLFSWRYWQSQTQHDACRKWFCMLIGNRIYSREQIFTNTMLTCTTFQSTNSLHMKKVYLCRKKILLQSAEERLIEWFIKTNVSALHQSTYFEWFWRFDDAHNLFYLILSMNLLHSSIQQPFFYTVLLLPLTNR